MKWRLGIAFLAIMIMSTFAVAQSNNMKTIYAHAGKDAGGAGFLYTGPRKWAGGFDFGIEGESEDFTGGGYEVENAWSLNLLWGINPFQNMKRSAVFFGLVGARTYKETCPTGQSYLGFQCYADADPDQHYKINYGGGIIVHLNRLAVGVRITGESETIIVGWNW